jgi:hypothetical protein
MNRSPGQAGIRLSFRHVALGIGVLLLLYSFSDGPIDNNEPNLAGAYDALIKYYLRSYVAWPLICISAVVILVARLSRSSTQEETSSSGTEEDLPKAVTLSEDSHSDSTRKP